MGSGKEDGKLYFEAEKDGGKEKKFSLLQTKQSLNKIERRSLCSVKRK